MHEKGMQHLREGHRGAALDAFRKSCAVTPEMASRLIEVLKSEKVEYVVSPYESDAQCTYMIKTGQVAAVISEDSDMVAYGCSRVFFKMDNEGKGEEIRSRNLGANEDLDLLNWLPSKFLEMCIIAGCDYLQSLPNIGIRKAHKLINEKKNAIAAIQHIRRDGQIAVPDNYENDFRRALLTFRHQFVYDIKLGKRVHLTEMEDDFGFTDLSFLGSDTDTTIEQQRKVARGELNPRTLEPFELGNKLADWKPNYGPAYGSAPQSNKIDNYLKPVAGRQPELMELFDLAEQRARNTVQSDEMITVETVVTNGGGQSSTANPFVTKTQDKMRPDLVSDSMSLLGTVGPTASKKKKPLKASKFFGTKKEEAEPVNLKEDVTGLKSVAEKNNVCDPQPTLATVRLVPQVGAHLQAYRYGKSNETSVVRSSMSSVKHSQTSRSVISLRPQPSTAASRVDIASFHYGAGSSSTAKRKAPQNHPHEEGPLSKRVTNAAGIRQDAGMGSAKRGLKEKGRVSPDFVASMDSMAYIRKL